MVTFGPGDVHEALVHIEATGGCVSLEAAARVTNLRGATVISRPPLAGRSVIGADDPFFDILATSPTGSASTTSCRGASVTLVSESLIHHFLRSEVVIVLGPE